MKKDILTVVVPNCSRQEALKLKREAVELKSKIAPKAKATMAVGKKENFAKIASRCVKSLEER